MAKIKAFYRFGTTCDGTGEQCDLLGGKGNGLQILSKMFPENVPPGFTLPTTHCKTAKPPKEKSLKLTKQLTSAIVKGMAYVAGKNKTWPLVSVRSGAAVSMPGMMDTILNVGLNDENLAHWKTKLGEHVALDCYRRLIQMYGTTVCGIDKELYLQAKVPSPAPGNHYTIKNLEDLIAHHKALTPGFPQDIKSQLQNSIASVFSSWHSSNAVRYRKIQGISNALGTAVTIQKMVFGNLNDQSCTGVLFTRDPDSGDSIIKGEFLKNAQGEDVVNGTSTPLNFNELKSWNQLNHHRLEHIAKILELHFSEVQDIEFTIESNQVYILQTRTAKRSAKAAFRFAHDMVVEGIITKDEALAKVTKGQYLATQKPQIDPTFSTPPDYIGIISGGGVVSGVAVFTSAAAKACQQPCILVASETTPDDLEGIDASVGILTKTGGSTCHAAVVARSLNKAAVVGCFDLTYNGKKQTWAVPKTPPLKEGDSLTIDGDSGRVWFHKMVPVVKHDSKFENEILSWAYETSGHFERGHISEQFISEKIFLDAAVCGEVVSPMMFLDSAKSFLQAGKTVVINLMSAGDYRIPCDDALWLLVGLGHSEPFDQHFFNALLNAKLNCLVLVPSRISNSSEKMTQLVDAGYTVVSSINSMEKLLDACGPIYLADELISTIGGSAIARKLVNRLASENASLMELQLPKNKIQILE